MFDSARPADPRAAQAQRINEMIAEARTWPAEAVWALAYKASEELNTRAREAITQTDFHRVVLLKVISVDYAPLPPDLPSYVHLHFCGPVEMRRITGGRGEARGDQALGYTDPVTGRRQNAADHTYVLAGPLPGGGFALDQFGLGHELGGHVLAEALSGVPCGDPAQPNPDKMWEGR